jgi:hypothetical protein
MGKRNYIVEIILFFSWAILNFTQGLITLNPFLTPEITNTIVAISRVAIGVVIFAYVGYLTTQYVGEKNEESN